MENKHIMPFFMICHRSTVLKSFYIIYTKDPYFYILKSNRNENYIYYVAYV
jgi:hypothetical protein